MKHTVYKFFFLLYFRGFEQSGTHHNAVFSS